MKQKETTSIIGYIHSIQTLGTLDGPGMRFVLFLQGCNLRCGCCHNPDTWDIHNFASTYTPLEILSQYQKYQMYYGTTGGITVSGGEPLLQAAFIFELFSLCKEQNIHTCLDTSGSIFHSQVANLLSVTDLVLLDIKYTNEDDYRNYVGCSYKAPLDFLTYLNAHHIDTWVRQVIIRDLNDDDKNIQLLNKIIASHDCVKRCQLLPFHKMCTEKYEKLNIAFPFADRCEPTKERIDYLEGVIKN